MRGGYYQRLVVVVVLVWSVLLHGSQAFAGLPAYTGKANVAVGGLINQKVGKWGFAANDPRVGATFAGVGGGLTYIAGGLVAGGVAAVSWPALLVGAGITAVVSGGIALAQDALFKWLFNSDGTVSTASAPPPVSSELAPGECYSWYALQDKICSGSPAGAIAELQTLYPYSIFVGSGSCAKYIMKAPCGEPNAIVMNSLPGKVMGRNFFGGGFSNLSGKPSLSHVTADAAIANVPAEELVKPASDAMLAAMANAAWKAQKPGSGGLPWSPSDPITPQDVAQWRQQNPDQVPNVGDVLAPSSPGGSSPVNVSPGGASPNPGTDPGTGPGPGPNPGPDPTPGTGTPVDLGPNPNTPAPMMEPTPTAQQILAPLLGLMPDLKRFAVPAHSSVCPKPSFVVYEKTYAIESHCSILEDNRSIIEAAMLLCWTLAAVFIVLRA